ncbi:MAG: hypothetical protein DCO97_05360 [Marivita sp. XM-24bin2]|jgi:hypothetical protein|nr:MAG: hypothetical protein DCO97_05360 [Marivita sp. XM-24bin2]
MRALVSVLLILGCATSAAVFMTIEICGVEGLKPENFGIIRTCRATDPPKEVFAGFFIIGGALGTIFAMVWLFLRRKKTIG